MSTPSLSELQAQFKAILKSEELGAEGSSLIAYIKSSEQVSVETRLGVYHYAYFARIEESLADDFPQLRIALGPELFSDVIRSYLDQYSSRYFTLAQVGRNLPEFLAQSFDIENHLELSELARREFALCLCAWSESSVPIHFSKLLELPEEEQVQQVLILSPSTQFFKNSGGALEIFFHVHGQVKTLELTPSMEQLLNEIRDGKCLGELVELITRDQELAAHAMTWISQWVAAGLVSGFRARE